MPKHSFNDNLLSALTYKGLAIIAGLSFISISGSYLGFLFLFVAFLFVAADKKSLQLFKGSTLPLSYLAFIFFWVIITLSIFVNTYSFSEFISFFKKTHYFLFVTVALYPITLSMLRGGLPSEKLKKLGFYSLLSLGLASSYGLFCILFKKDIIRKAVIDEAYRLSGLFSVSSSYANVAVLILTLGFGICAFKLYPQKQRLVSILLIVATLGLYFSYTRSALLALLCGFVFLFWTKGRYLRWAFLLLLGATTISGIVLGVFGGTSSRYFQSLNSGSNSERATQFKLAFIMFKENPLLGVGYRQFDKNDSIIKLRENLPHKNFTGNAHNNFLEILSTTGILGLLAYLLWMLFWVIEMRAFPKAIRTIAYSMFIAFHVGGLFHSNIIDAESLITLCTLYVLCVSYSLYLRITQKNDVKQSVATL